MKLISHAALTLGLLALTAQPATIETFAANTPAANVLSAETSAPYEIAMIKDDDSIYLSLAATEPTDIEGISLRLDYDRDAFTMGGTYASEGLSFSGNNTDGVFVLYGAEDLHLEAGDTLAAVGFTASAAMDGQTEYEFACTIDEAYDDSTEALAWVGQTLTYTYTDSTAVTGKFTPPAGDAAGVYTVTFVDDDGTVLSSQSVDASDPYAVLYEPESEGRDFAGWTLDGKAFDEETKISGNVTLAAMWAESESEEASVTDAAADGAGENADANTGAPSASQAGADTSAHNEASGTRNPALAAVLAAAVLAAAGAALYVIRKKKAES